MKGDRDRCLAAGMDAYVSKPLRPQQLFEVLEGLVPAAAEAGSALAGSEAQATAFDLAAALERVDGDLELMKELAGLFLSECPQRMTEIRQAIDLRDASRLRQGAHTLKGSLGVFGAREAFEVAERLETDGREQDWGQAEQDWAALEEAIGRLKPALVGLGQAGISESLNP
jgi:HPt (histidine-containing phosphotransfer) domain-containing protein